jgi:hypothetical protein
MAKRKKKRSGGHLPISILRHRLRALKALVRKRSRKARKAHHRRSR